MPPPPTAQVPQTAALLPPPTAPVPAPCPFPGPTPCMNGRVHAGCTNRMCRRHCNMSGPCAYPPHEKNCVLKSQSDLPPRQPPRQPPKAARRRSAISTVIEDPDVEEVRRKAFEEYWAREQARIAAQEHELDQSLSMQVLSPSPEISMEDAIRRYDECEAHEVQIEEDRALALRLQEVDDPLPSSSSLAGPSNLRSLSPSPDFPAVIDIVPLPVRVPAIRAPAPSAKPKRRAIAPKITKQLSDAWLSTAAHSDIAAVPPTGTSFLHVKRARGRRNEEERRRVERFTVAYLTGEKEAGTRVVDLTTLSGLTWPFYQLDRDPETIDYLGNTLNDLQVYMDSITSFVGIRADYLHTVKTDGVLILRRRGSVGPRDDKILHGFLNQAVPHLRHRLPQERTAREALKAVGTHSDSDSDVEVSDVRQGKRRAHHMSPASENGGRIHRRPRLSIDTAVPATSSSSSASALTVDSAPPSALSLAPSTASSASDPASPTSSEVFVSDIRPMPWPQGTYVEDVVPQFLKMHSSEFAHLLRGPRFELIFQRPYKSATYDAHFGLWQRAPQVWKEKFLQAGRTKSGLWTAFAKKAREVARGGGDADTDD
ncbi:hypothetical protein GGX14DRAFT_604413 [Mycena pura]|uniref:Uncharacterized protein n=1 Tax=Mycena pura TaxID=153505 RepID=A0AAD6YJQ1_9AGAR|nr:hypothetical protein GGX14DRAFT_604413 [Mycena pura]